MPAERLLVVAGRLSTTKQAFLCNVAEKFQGIKITTRVLVLASIEKRQKSTFFKLQKAWRRWVYN
jgi:hypothetical protein